MRSLHALWFILLPLVLVLPAWFEVSLPVPEPASRPQTETAEAKSEPANVTSPVTGK